mgnify:CR=1 FL=1
MGESEKGRKREGGEVGRGEKERERRHTIFILKYSSIVTQHC